MYGKRRRGFRSSVYSRGLLFALFKGQPRVCEWEAAR